MTQRSVEGALQRLAEGEWPGDLSIIYDDVHGLWGGVRITVSADGAYERLAWERGSAAPVVARGMLAPAQLQDLAHLLLEIRAWEQQTPDAQPVADESRATVAIRCAGAASSIWERYNDLAAGRRLVRVREWLSEIVAADQV